MTSQYEETRKRVGEIIKEYRVMRKNWSQEKLSETINVSANNIGRIERGETLPHFLTYMKLSDALGLNQNEHQHEIAEQIKSDEER